MVPQKIFFSYSRLDSSFALKLAKDLREAGADIWIDQLDIQAGSHWDAAVEKALNAAACVMVIISPASTSSTNVMDEVSFALETGKKIIPVMLEECPPPFRLRRLQRIDFTKNYDSGLTQLLLTLGLSTPSHKTSKHLVMAGEPQGEDDAQPDDETLKAEKEEMMLWDEACRQHTIEAYEKYMIKSMTGTYKGEARLMIKQLELEEKEDELETLLWQKSQSEHSLHLYQHYLEEYPDGDYKTLALAAIAELEKQDKPDHEQRHVIPANAPVSSQVPERPVRKKVIFFSIGISVAGLLVFALTTVNQGNDKDLMAWQTATSKKDSTSFAAYMLAFPKGKYIVEAQDKLDSIRLQQERQQDSTSTASLIPVGMPDTTSVIATPPLDTIKKTTAPIKPKTTPPSKPDSKFTIGQKYQGGIIAYIHPSGSHGLIIAEKDFTGLDWEAAKKKCETSKASGYYDWRLPTKEELHKIYQNRQKTGVFSKGMYWSSSDAEYDMVWTLNLVQGNVGKFSKKMSWYARAVRPF